MEGESPSLMISEIVSVITVSRSKSVAIGLPEY